jgi:hypothetical protein
MQPRLGRPEDPMKRSTMHRHRLGGHHLVRVAATLAAFALATVASGCGPSAWERRVLTPLSLVPHGDL